MDPPYFDADALPIVRVLTDGQTGRTIERIEVHNNQGAVEIVLAFEEENLPDRDETGYYLGSVYDRRHLDYGPIAYLKIIIY